MCVLTCRWHHPSQMHRGEKPCYSSWRIHSSPERQLSAWTWTLLSLSGHLQFSRQVCEHIASLSVQKEQAKPWRDTLQLHRAYVLIQHPLMMHNCSWTGHGSQVPIKIPWQDAALTCHCWKDSVRETQSPKGFGIVWKL